MSASAGLRPIQVSRSSSPPVADDQETAAAAADDGSGISEADPGYCCHTPTSEGSRLPPEPLNCPPPPTRKRKWRRRPRRRQQQQVLELITVEAEELEQLFQRRSRAVDQPTTAHAKRVKVQDSDHAD